MLVGMSLFEGAALLSDIAGGPLSAVAWLPVFVTGMVIGRLDLRSSKTSIRLAAIGTAVALPVKLFAVSVLPEIYQSFCNWLVQFSSSPLFRTPMRRGPEILSCRFGRCCSWMHRRAAPCLNC